MITVKTVETMSIILLLWENSALFTAQYMEKTHQALGCEKKVVSMRERHFPLTPNPELRDCETFS
jgi:hypothetical protein